MLDQLHIFPNLAAAESVFPCPQDDEGNLSTTPCWRVGNATVMPVTLMMKVEDGVVPSTFVWYGLTVSEENADVFWAYPSAQVELKTPTQLTYWIDCITRSRADPVTFANVAYVTPIFAGSAYDFKYKEPVTL